MDVNVQSISGIRGDRARNAVFMYKNITNIVVKLSPKNVKSNAKNMGSLLISSHYDSAVSSPGAFDDGVPVAVMLEVISNIVNENANSSRIAHETIFLFNDGEEVGLLGSSAFIKKHEWASSVKVFLNLEAAGSAGKAILFQATNAWVMNEYATAIKHPKGNVAAQDIFNLDIIPSDTDYRIYSTELRLGSASGIDTAFYLNGYHYHSYMDNFERVEKSPGSVQSMGDNTLAFVRHFAYMKSEFLTGESFEEDTVTKAVFIDLFGYKLVSVNVELTIAPYMITFMVSLILLLISIFRVQRTVLFLRTYFFINLFRVFVSLVLIMISCGLSLLLPYLCSIITATYLQAMTYYAISPYYIFILYGPAALLGACIPIVYFPKYFVINQRSIYVAVWLIWIIILGVGASIPIGSTYLAFAAVITFSIGFFLWGKLSQLFFVVVPIPTLFLMDTVSNVTEVFVPMMGRMNIPAETAMALLASGSLFLLFSLAVPFLYNEKATLLPKRSVLVLFAMSIGILLISKQALFPYSAERPKRSLVQHVHVHSAIEFRNGSTLPLKYIDSYVGLSADDSIPSSFIQQHAALPFKFEYNIQSPLFAVLSQSAPDEAEGSFVSSTRKIYNNETTLPSPMVSVRCDDQICNRVFIKIADHNGKHNAFSHEVTILSRASMYDSSLGDILKADERVHNMTHPANQQEKIKIYRSRVYLCSGSPYPSPDHEIWISFASKTLTSKECLIQVSVKSVFLDKAGFSKEMNDTLDSLPKWVAPIPAMGTFRVLNFLLDV
jgi:hypothetical protein